MPFFLIKERDEHEEECNFSKERKVFTSNEEAKWLENPLVMPEDYDENQDNEEEL